MTGATSCAAVMVFWPRPVEPTSPTEVFGALLGPLADMADKGFKEK